MKVNNYEFKKELISINDIKYNKMFKIDDCIIIKEKNNINPIKLDINSNDIIQLSKFLNENLNIKIINLYDENYNENPLLKYFNFPKFNIFNYNINFNNNNDMDNYYSSNIKNDKIGTHLSLMKSINQILIMENNFNLNKSFIINLNEKIIYYTFNPVNPYQISIITINYIYIYNIKEYEIIKKLNSSKNIIKVKYSLDGKYFIVLYKNSFEVYNEIYEKLYDKTFILNYLFHKNKFLNVKISSDSKYFTIFSNNYFYIYNFKNFDCKIFYFHTQIINNIFYNNNKEIILFTLNEFNQLFSYKIIFYLNYSNQYYINNYISYNTINMDYFHDNFIVDNNINLFLNNCENIIKIDYFNNIILIFFKNIITKNNELIAYQITDNNQFISLFCFENFYNKNLIDFTVYYDYFEKKYILLCNYENNYLTKSFFI